MTVARLALVQGVVTVLASGLGLLGVEAPEEMPRSLGAQGGWALARCIHRANRPSATPVPQTG